MEHAYLPYPLGTHDDPPDLIGFVGAEARPLHDVTGDIVKHRRGCVTIDCLGLNRDSLVTLRAEWLLQVWITLRSADRGDEEAMKLRDMLKTARASFSSCASCFIKLWEEDSIFAEEVIAVLRRIVSIDEGRFDSSPSFLLAPICSSTFPLETRRYYRGTGVFFSSSSIICSGSNPPYFAFVSI